MLGRRGALMNSFYEHHKDSIRWHYRCFDRILLNGLIQPFQQPERVLQQLADSLDPWELSTCGQKWLARLTPFFTAKERQEAGCQHRLFFSQIEFCDNLIFRRRAALDNLGERLLDANRTIGQPNKITMIFGRRISRHHRGKLQTEIEDMNLPNPVIRSHYGSGFIKQYLRDHLIFRTLSPRATMSTTVA